LCLAREKIMANVIDLYNECPPVRINEAKGIKRQKRTEADMLASVAGDVISEAQYLKERLMKLEQKMSDLIGSVSAEARDMVLSRASHLERYRP
jgi:hypothetical protein